MLELLLCSLLTILPDYLYRRYAQGRRLGKEITLYSVWFELRWGIVSCLLLTVGLITAIFYFHPATTYATAVFRSVPVLPDAGGRVASSAVNSRSRRAGVRSRDCTKRSMSTTSMPTPMTGITRP